MMMPLRLRPIAPLLLVTLCLAGVGCGGGESAVDTNQVEVFHWWTSGSEADAMQEVFEAYRAAYPTVEIIDATVAGGGGSAARPILQTRLVGGNPPDTWQTHPGTEVLGQYVTPGFAAPLGDLYAEEGWHDVFPEALIDMVSREGEPYLVILNLHRSNTLWYNKAVLDRHQLVVADPMTHDDLFVLLDALQAAGETPLCMGDSGIWANGIMFENVLLGVLGPERYLGLWDGSVGFDAADVKQAMQIHARLLDYLNADHAALSWDQAAQKMVSGGCALYSMGDWAYGEFTRAGLKDGEDFGWVAHPGTEGGFLMVSDGFTLAQGAPHPGHAREMLRLMGTTAVQEAFNLKKGSICARSDCDPGKFTPYLNWSMQSYAEDALVPTVIHGSAAPADFQQALNDALTSFVVDRNVEAFSASLVREARMSGFATQP